MEKTETIIISNEQYCRRREQYTKGLREDLDPRDREFVHPFNILFNVSQYQRQKQCFKSQQNQMPKQQNVSNKIKSPSIQKSKVQDCTSKIQNQGQPESLRKPKEYLNLKRKVYDYLSEVCQNSTSIAFRLLSKGDLSQNQVKAFASKTILANIQSVQADIKQKFISFLPGECNELLQDLTDSIDKKLGEVFSELATHYPQASTVGVTARIKQVIAEVNRTQDENNDFIFANDIQIQKYIRYDTQGKVILNDPQSYTVFVMDVINKAIGIAGETLGQDETQFERFQYFNQRLFAFSQHKDCKATINRIKDEMKNSSNAQQQESIQRQLFLHLFDNKNQSQLQPLKQIQAAQQEWQQKAKQKHRYSISQKIPSHVKQFNNVDLKECNFCVNNSSVLRMMTKWAEYLQEIFEKPEKQIGQRLYKFKDVNNKPTQADYYVKRDLIKKLNEEYKHVKSELRKMQEKNILFQSFILSQSEKGTSYLKRYTQVRSAAAQINAFTIQFTRKYLCILIHHLVKAGNIMQLSKNKKINLVVFRVGDLLRSKFQCSERSFINVINTLSLLDESKEMEGKFKLVRVKNKLNMRDNNVIINFMFMEKVQCELQLSIQKMEKKDKNYYDFCHFLYELTRGKFGVLTEIATVVCQHDPIVSASSEAYYRPKRYEQVQSQKNIVHQIHKKSEDIYKCRKCGELRVRENISLFNEQQKVCNQCITKEEDAQSKLNPVSDITKFRQYLSRQYNLQVPNLKKIYHYGEIEDGKYVISVNNGRMGAKLKLFKSSKLKGEIKHFLIEINDYVLGNFDKKDFKYISIDYFDISFQMKKKIKLKELTYILDDISAQTFQAIGVQANLFQKVGKFLDEFKNFRMEKNVIKTIKIKSQLIDCTEDIQMLSIFDKVAKAFGSKDMNKDMREQLRYTRINELEWTHIKSIRLIYIGIKQAPQFFKYATNCARIELRQLKIIQMSFQNQAKLQVLSIYYTPLKKIILEKNTHLRQLSIKDTQLQQIQLSQNISLKQIDLSCNKLQQLDLRHNTSLTKLDLKSNKLQKIDLTQNTNLTQLFLFNNKLRQIDLTKNINLKQLNLDCNYQLRKIDLTQNISLTQLGLSYDQLQQIDLTKNVNLNQLDLSRNYPLIKIDLTQNTYLMQLDLSDCRLQEIDLTHNTNLKRLNIQKNKLKQIDLSFNQKLSQLFLCQNKLSSVVFWISEFTSFSELKINHQQSKQCNIVLLYSNHKGEIQKCNQISETLGKNYDVNHPNRHWYNKHGCEYTFVKEEREFV